MAFRSCRGFMKIERYDWSGTSGAANLDAA